MGITCPGACLWDNVILPSEFGHKITIGVFAICEPKPLEWTLNNKRKKGRCEERTWPSTPMRPIPYSEECLYSFQLNEHKKFELKSLTLHG